MPDDKEMSAAEFRGYAKGALERLNNFLDDFYEGRNGEPSYSKIILTNQELIVKHLKECAEAEKNKSKKVWEIIKITLAPIIVAAVTSLVVLCNVPK